MIISNLSSIMGQKKLKIADIMKKTGITRPTLTKLYYNDCSGITFDTLNSLCSFLNITPSELLLFINADIKDIEIKFDPDVSEDFIEVDEYGNGEMAITYASFTGTISFAQTGIPQVNITGSLDCYNVNHEYDYYIVYYIPNKSIKELFINPAYDFIIGKTEERIFEEFANIDEEAIPADSVIDKRFLSDPKK